jgi:hypothetical protein
LTLAAVALACAAGGIRPRLLPAPGAVMLVLDLPAAEVTDSLAAAARRAGLMLFAVAPREGYVETRWFDLDAHATTRPPFDRLERVVKLRFFADPVAGRTRLFAECVVRIAWDPSVPERDLERMPPAGHPGRALLDSVLVVMQPHVVRDTAKVTGGPPLRERAPRDTAKARP